MILPDYCQPGEGHVRIDSMALLYARVDQKHRIQGHSRGSEESVVRPA